MRRIIVAALLAISAVLVPFTNNAAQSAGTTGVGNGRAWTQLEMANATPRDFFLDERGLAYIKSRAGEFVPYGHATKFAGGTKSPDTTKGRTKPSPSPSPTATQLPVISNAVWTLGGNVQPAAGRLYFYMPTTGSSLTDISTWAGFVCSGTVVTDTKTDQSLILTAAHCIYDDVNKVFAQRVMFIPNQSASGTKTDRDCYNDVLGCWLPSYGVVDSDWSSRKFPANAEWDYGFYVVSDKNSHLGTGDNPDLALDKSVSAIAGDFSSTITSGYTYALGYSYNQDPSFMYCAQTLGSTTQLVKTGQPWLSQCGLSGGASGGPWMQSAGAGPVFSLNSWGYSNSVGMAGPRLGLTTQCLRTSAETSSLKPASGGLVANC